MSGSYVAAVGEFWKGLSGVNCTFAFSYVREPNLMPEPPHKHDNDLIPFFVSGDPENISTLGTEIEIALGEEWEKNIITNSAIVYLPKGLQHCPINDKRVDRLFLFDHIWNVVPQADVQLLCVLLSENLRLHYKAVILRLASLSMYFARHQPSA